MLIMQCNEYQKQSNIVTTVIYYILPNSGI